MTSTVARWIRGLAAAVILAAAIIGLPIALASTVGNPLHSLPSLTANQLPDSAVIAILTLVFWLAWLSFVVPALLEIAVAVTARITRRPVRHVRVPMLGAQHHLARTLVSAVLLIAPVTTTALAASASTPVSHHTVNSAGTIVPTVTRNAPPSRATDTTHGDRGVADRYVIPQTGGMRSYWSLAEHYLGDGARWREIWALNQGRARSDGALMDSPRELHAGWTILIPDISDRHSPVASTVDPEMTVSAGDTLSGIATDSGIASWHQIWELNADRPEPGGVRFTNPNLIRPGWTITLPPAHRAAAPSLSDTHPPQVRRVNGSAPDWSAAPVTSTSPARTLPEQPSAPASPASSALPDGPEVAATGSPSNSSVTGRDASHHGFPIVPLTVGLAAVGGVASLDRARRVAQRRRRAGHRPLPPPPTLVAVEAQLRRDARRALPAIAAVTLAAALTGTEPTAVRSVLARTDGAVDLHLDDPPPAPPPFDEVPGGWRLPANATGFGYATENPDSLDDPHPVLLPIGSVQAGQVLINLSTADPVSIAGDPDDVEAFCLQVLIALHAAPWAGRVLLHVPPTMVGPLAALERLTVADATNPQPPAEEPRRADHPDDADSEEEPGWRTAPVHLFCGWTRDADLTAILTAASRRRDVHLLVIGMHPGTSTWTLDGDQLVVPGLVEPVTITVPESAVMPDAGDLLRHTATAPDVAAGDPRLPQIHLDPSADHPTVTHGADPAEQVTEPRLRLLGPVELDGKRHLPRALMFNMLTLLALHPGGVTRDQLCAALWPDQVVSSQTLRNRIRETRRLLNGGITDGPNWRLDDTVTTDWGQFTVLADGDVEDQRLALTLVRGRPFTGLEDADWIDLGAFRSEVEATIVDVALAITDHDLTTGNYSGALAAARTGLLASRYEERLHRAGIRAAIALGQHGIADTMRGEMRTVLDLDIEPDDQMQPETIALIRELRDHQAATGKR